MSPFLVLVVFGFIQVGLSASFTNRDDCVNNDDEAVRLFGLNCDDIPSYDCDRDDVKAICPAKCEGVKCYLVGVENDCGVRPEMCIHMAPGH